MFDATFFAFVGLVVFLGLIAYLKVPGMITTALDERADKIRNQLDEARNLREEAAELLSEYQRKRKEAEEEAATIVTAAKKEADVITAEARVQTQEYVERRTAMAEQKIAQAEVDAVNAVRATAVDVAIAASEQLLGDKMTAKSSGDLFKKSIADIKAGLN